MERDRQDYENAIREAFYREFVEDICSNLSSNLVLDRLYRLNVLTKTERYDDIGNLSTYDKRSRFVHIMQERDLDCTVKLVRVLDEVCGEGQRNMVRRMKEYLRQNIPELRSHEVPVAGPSTTARANSSTTASSFRPSFPNAQQESMPNVVSNFVERTCALEKLHELVIRRGLSDVGAFALLTGLSGLGGVGKTTLARRYVDYFKTHFPRNGVTVFWIESESMSTLRLSFRNFAKFQLRLDVDQMEDTTTLVSRVYTELAERTCLLVFDNVTEYEGADGIVDFLPASAPASQHYFLATSRRSDLTTAERIMRLDVFTNDEATHCLLKALPNSSIESRRRLATLLGCLPLAPQQAAAYLQQSAKLHPNETAAIEAYVSEYEANVESLLDSELRDENGRKTEKTVYLTWQTTLTAIKKHELGSLACRVLRCLAYLNPDNVDLYFLTAVNLRGFSRTAAFMLPLQRSFGIDSARYSSPPATVIKAVELLDKYSMISLQAGRISVHRLVQDVVRMQSRNGDVPECRFILRILAHIDASSNTDMEQVILHGTVILPYYDKYSSLKEQYPNFAQRVFEDQRLLKFVLDSTCTKNSAGALDLIQLLGRNQEAIRVALVLITNGKGRDVLKRYVQVSKQFLRDFGSAPGQNFVGRARVYNWANLLATENVKLNETEHILMRCLPYLNFSCVTHNFLLALLSNTSDGDEAPTRTRAVRVAMDTLREYQVIQDHVSEPYVSLPGFWNTRGLLHKYCLNHNQFNHLLKFLWSHRLASDALNEECMLHTMSVNRLDAMANTNFRSEFKTRCEIIDDIRTLALLPDSHDGQIPAVRLAQLLNFDRKNVSRVLEFSRKLARTQKQDDTKLSACVPILKLFEQTVEFNWAKQLGGEEGAKFMIWLLARETGSQDVRLAMDCLLFLNPLSITVDFLQMLWLDLDASYSLLQFLINIGLLTIIKSHVKRGRQVLKVAEIPSVLNDRRSTCWKGKEKLEALRTVMIVIRTTLRGFPPAIKDRMTRAQCIVHGQHILHMTIGNPVFELGTQLSEFRELILHNRRIEAIVN